MVIDVDLVPGAYVLVCRVRDPSDGKPHNVHGMLMRIAVR